MKKKVIEFKHYEDRYIALEKWNEKSLGIIVNGYKLISIQEIRETKTIKEVWERI